MALGIQITRSKNASLLNSFWLLDEANAQAGCLCVKDDAYAEDQIVSPADLGEIEDKAFRLPRCKKVDNNHNIGQHDDQK